MKQTFKKPSYYLLSQAMDGDEKAIEKILAFYDPYISKCCLRPLYDEYGNVYIVVDMELKGLIREALIKMILGFDIALEIEEEYQAVTAEHDLFNLLFPALPLLLYESNTLSPQLFDN